MRTFTSFHLSSCGWMEASNVFLTLCFAWPGIFNLHFMQAWINHTLPVSTFWKFSRNNCCQSLSWRGFSHKIHLYFMSSTLLLLITQRGKKKSVSSSHPLVSLFCSFVDFFFNSIHQIDKELSTAISWPKCVENEGYILPKSLIFELVFLHWFVICIDL